MGLYFTPHTDHVMPRMRNPQIGVIHMSIYDIARISKTTKANQHKNLAHYWYHEIDAILLHHIRNKSKMADGRHVENRPISPYLSEQVALLSQRGRGMLRVCR